VEERYKRSILTDYERANPVVRCRLPVCFRLPDISYLNLFVPSRFVPQASLTLTMTLTLTLTLILTLTLTPNPNTNPNPKPIEVPNPTDTKRRVMKRLVHETSSVFTSHS